MSSASIMSPENKTIPAIQLDDIILEKDPNFKHYDWKVEKIVNLISRHNNGVGAATVKILI